MGQVPGQTTYLHKPYLLIGNGRLAKHMAQYFEHLSIDFHHWYRGFTPSATDSFRSLKEQAQLSDKILFAISDQSIGDFVEKLKRQSIILDHHQLIHFSGSFSHPNILGFHPLCTFSKELYDEKFYRKIPFIGDETLADFRTLFPELPNPHFHLDESDKKLYHAYCSIAGNFSQILWSKLFFELKNKFNLPEQVCFPFMEKTISNLTKEGPSAITGPFVRKDQKTIDDHLQALEDDQFLEIYSSFYNYAKSGELSEISQ